MERVELTPREAEYADQIASYDVGSFEFNECDYGRTMKACKKLTESLLKRDVIPQHRIKYFTNAEYNLGRGNKSRKYYFEEILNGKGDILEHQDFLKYLDYFINGSKLTQEFKEKLQKVKDECAYDSDFPDESYTIIRAHFRKNTDNIQKKDFANEVFKLCLDMGLSLYVSSRVQEKLMRIR